MTETVVENHITKEELEQGLDRRRLEHIAACSHCASLLGDYVEQEHMIEAPKNFKESVLFRSRQPDIAIIAASNQYSKKLVLLTYSLKVGLAVLCVLALLFLPNLHMPAIQVKPAGPPVTAEWKYYQRIENLTSYLHNLSFIKTEDIQNDQKEK